jgi:hypothetical protein
MPCAHRPVQPGSLGFIIVDFIQLTSLQDKGRRVAADFLDALDATLERSFLVLIYIDLHTLVHTK